MIFTPYDLQAFLAVCKAEIPEINYTKSVIDDSQMAKDISDIHLADNLLLYGVLPDYGGDSRDDDALMMDNGLDFLILKKQQYSEMTDQDFIDDLQTTLLVSRKLIEEVYKEKNSPNLCPTFYFLKEGSERITPVWAKAGCNGYMISFNLRTSL